MCTRVIAYSPTSTNNSPRELAKVVAEELRKSCSLFAFVSERIGEWQCAADNGGAEIEAAGEAVKSQVSQGTLDAKLTVDARGSGALLRAAGGGHLHVVRWL